MKTSITILVILFSVVMQSQTFEINGSLSNTENKENTITISLFESSKTTIVKIIYPLKDGQFNFTAVPIGN
jgi:hypothetical protein